MPTGTLFNLQGLTPAFLPMGAADGAFVLPCGGPVGVGGGFAQGQALGLTGVAQQSHIFTLTVTTNSATGGIGYFTYYGDTMYSGLSTGGLTTNSVGAYPTAAQMQAALIAAVPVWAGNVTVTGSTGGPYTVTFNTLMANKLVGGLLQFTFTSATGGSPTIAVTTAQNGSCGARQANIYNSSTNNRMDGFLQYQTFLDPVGCPAQLDLIGNVGQASGGVPVWLGGYFYADTTNFPEKSVVGLDANAMTLGKLVFVYGTSLSTPGVVVNLIG